MPAVLVACDNTDLVIDQFGVASCSSWVQIDPATFSLLPPLAIDDALLIASSFVGLLAIVWGIKMIGRLITWS